MQKPKLTKPDISVLSVEPKYIDKFWPLCDFMIAEALKFLFLEAMKRNSIKSLHYL
jgi:hypothetical protein